MTQDLYQKAIQFAAEKHCNQKMPGSKANYLQHISNVAMEILLAYSSNNGFDVDLAVQIAILHDIIEDTDSDFEEVKNLFGLKVANGVLALTKNNELPTKKEQMLDSLHRINQLEKEVGMVKLADRITNLQVPPHYWDKDKKISYLEEAKLIAETLKNKNDYLNSRLQKKIEEYTQYIKA